MLSTAFVRFNMPSTSRWAAVDIELTPSMPTDSQSQYSSESSSSESTRSRRAPRSIFFDDMDATSTNYSQIPETSGFSEDADMSDSQQSPAFVAGSVSQDTEWELPAFDSSQSNSSESQQSQAPSNSQASSYGSEIMFSPMMSSDSSTHSSLVPLLGSPGARRDRAAAHQFLRRLGRRYDPMRGNTHVRYLRRHRGSTSSASGSQSGTEGSSQDSQESQGSQSSTGSVIAGMSIDPFGTSLSDSQDSIAPLAPVAEYDELPSSGHSFRFPSPEPMEAHDSDDMMSQGSSSEEPQGLGLVFGPEDNPNAGERYRIDDGTL